MSWERISLTQVDWWGKLRGQQGMIVSDPNQPTICCHCKDSQLWLVLAHQEGGAFPSIKSVEMCLKRTSPQFASNSSQWKGKCVVRFRDVKEPSANERISPKVRKSWIQVFSQDQLQAFESVAADDVILQLCRYLQRLCVPSSLWTRVITQLFSPQVIAPWSRTRLVCSYTCCCLFSEVKQVPDSLKLLTFS